MKTLYYYLYYRFSKFYDEWDEIWDWSRTKKDGHISGSLILFGSFAFIFVSFLIFLFFLFDKKIDAYSCVAIVVVFSVLSLFFINKKKYNELEERYKDEKHSKLKGWLVFLYFIGSIASFFISMSLCGYWQSKEGWM